MRVHIALEIALRACDIGWRITMTKLGLSLAHLQFALLKGEC